MPVSDYRQISEVLHMIAQLKPRRILDVGVGFGKWGVLCREVLDVSAGRLRSEDWATTIDGIEIFGEYRSSIWDHAYNEVLLGDALSVIDALSHYDVVLACDVIEHFDKPMGQILLGKLMERAAVVIITSPRGFVPQGAEFGNASEIHKSGWTQHDFVHLPHLYRDNAGGFMVIVASNPDDLQALRLRFSPLDQLGVKWGSREFGKLLLNRVRERLARARARLRG